MSESSNTSAALQARSEEKPDLFSS